MHKGIQHQKYLTAFFSFTKVHHIPWTFLNTHTRVIGPILISKTRKSKFLHQAQNWQKPMRILTIEKILSISIWLPNMPNINALAKYVIVNHCLSHFSHHRKGYSIFSKHTTKVCKHDNLRWTYTNKKNSNQVNLEHIESWMLKQRQINSLIN